MIQQVKITNAANGGYGVARIDGKTVFVDFGVPGDVLDVEVCRDMKSFSFAEIRAIVEPSPLRVEPLCANFSHCGGCSWQNVSYETEIAFKETILRDQLTRVTGLKTESIPHIDIIKGERYKYRSHASVKTDGSVKGFFRKESDSLIPFPPGGCALLHDKLNEGISGLDPSVLMKDTKTAVTPSGEFVYDDGFNELLVTENENGYKFRRDITGFFQANRFLRSAMINRVIEYAEPSGSDTFMDICCGCGFFSIPAAARSARGYCFDNERRSIENAGYNCSLNNISNLVFYVLPESEIHPFRYKPDFIIVDPPRAGISKNGRRTINAINPVRLVYVSCDPSTFARDASDFIKNGYTLDKLTLIDMFPCTKHIEVISVFTRV